MTKEAMQVEAFEQFDMHGSRFMPCHWEKNIYMQSTIKSGGALVVKFSGYQNKAGIDPIQPPIQLFLYSFNIWIISYNFKFFDIPLLLCSL